MAASPPEIEAPLALPVEIVLQIISYITYGSASQKTLYNCCRVSRTWYFAAIARLYEEPYLYGPNFDPFVRTICPSINAHVRKSELADLVKVLDMGHLVHQGSKSVTARLIGRTKKNLEVFVAPRATFAYNCFAALSKCQNLRSLDLSLITESVGLPRLFSTLKNLTKLKRLVFPRSHINEWEIIKLVDHMWPPDLQHLDLSGSWLNDIHLKLVPPFPHSLRSLIIQDMPFLSTRAIEDIILQEVGPSLTWLKIHRMRSVARGSLDNVIILCPNVKHLIISYQYISPYFANFDEWPTASEKLPSPALEFLELPGASESHPSGLPIFSDDETLQPGDLEYAVERSYLPKLRRLRVGREAEWERDEDLESLALLLDVKAQEDADELSRLDQEKGISGGAFSRKPAASGVWIMQD